MNRIEKKAALRRKRRWALIYASSSVLTAGIMFVLVFVALDQVPGSWSWFGLWAYALYQLVTLVIHVRSTLRLHREAEELLEKFTREQSGGRHEA